MVDDVDDEDEVAQRTAVGAVLPLALDTEFRTRSDARGDLHVDGLGRTVAQGQADRLTAAERGDREGDSERARR